VIFGWQRQITGGVLAPAVTHVTWSVLMLRFLPPIFRDTDPLPATLAATSLTTSDGQVDAAGLGFLAWGNSDQWTLGPQKPRPALCGAQTPPAPGLPGEPGQATAAGSGRG
jgi:hypothetical protein